MPYLTTGFAGGITHLIQVRWETTGISSPTKSILDYMSSYFLHFFKLVTLDLLVTLLPWVPVGTYAILTAGNSSIYQPVIMGAIYILFLGIFARMFLKKKVRIHEKVMGQFIKKSDMVMKFNRDYNIRKLDDIV